MPPAPDLLAGIVQEHTTDVITAAGATWYMSAAMFTITISIIRPFPMFNCMLIDLKAMLTVAFKMGERRDQTAEVDLDANCGILRRLLLRSPARSWRHHH
ncbi:hypothetical protein ACLB1M_02430 [Escherichia coli]